MDAFADQEIDYVSITDAAGRFNLSISPKDADWNKVHAKFSKLLESEKTLETILAENFTHHETRMFIVSDRADIKEIQKQNTRRFHSLLESRFKGIEPNLATKFAMMYFGLPVEPLISPLDELRSLWIGDKDDGPRYTIEPPLHFLTAHADRNWGKDGHKGTFTILGV